MSEEDIENLTYLYVRLRIKWLWVRVQLQSLNLTYHDRCCLLNSNPVLVAGHFQYQVEVFFKEIVVDGSLRKTKYYATHIEF